MHKLPKDWYSSLIIKWLLGIFLLITLSLNATFIYGQHYSLLAESFTHLRTYFTVLPDGWTDTVLVNGHHYWPLGPFPAILLSPFVFLAEKAGFFFYQGYLNFFLGVSVLYLVYLLARSLNFSKTDKLYWTFAFGFVSPFLLPFYWSYSSMFAHTVAVSLTLLFLHLILNTKKPEWLLGTIIALLLATRPFAGLACCLFVLFYALNTNDSFSKAVGYCIRVFAISPFILITTILLFYNQYTFHHLLGGYNEQILTYPPLIQARLYGLFSLKHIPGNIYYSVLSLPQPVLKDGVSQVLAYPYLEATPWGTSIFFVAPYLFYLFLISYKKIINKILLSVSIITFIPILMYYGVGLRQYGYRYALDFFPFLFLLLMIGYKDKYGELNNTTKILIITFAFINLWFFATIVLK